jgi:hypothetical protein
MRRIYTILFVFSFAVILLSQTKITGKVTDQSNSPLPGANIYIKDTYDGTSSSADGTFLSAQERRSGNRKLYRIKQTGQK